MKNIQHNPIFNSKTVEKLYTEKDGVNVSYVCTSSITEMGTMAVDVFYRETPHPNFGNRYFGLYINFDNKVMITNADDIEKVTFDMVNVDGFLHYSQHRHDYRTIGDVSIDGGRAYTKRAGNLSRPIEKLKVKDGVFVNV